MILFAKFKKMLTLFKQYIGRHKQNADNIKELKALYEKQEKILTQQQNTINKLRKTLTKKSKTLDALTERVDAQETLLREATSKNRKKRKKIGKKCNEVEEIVEDTRDVVHTLLKTECRWCPEVWCIKDFASKRKLSKLRDDEKIISDPFFMLNGYKAQAFIYLNGYGDDTNKHVSIFIRLIEGPIDEQLRWPMVGCIEFGVVHDNEIEVASHIYTNSPICHEAFRRPDKENDRIWGFFDFIPLGNLHKYIEDDCLYIRISAWSINR